MHVQSKYAIDLPEARRVFAEHEWARVITAGAAGLRRLERHEDPLGESRWRLEGGGLELSLRIAPHTIAFRLRADRAEAKAKLSQAMPRPVRERIVERLDAPGPHHHPKLAALMRRVSLATPSKETT